MWYYQSPIGLMRIYKNANNRYTLEIAGEKYGFYSSPAKAADDVYTFCTGCHAWDSSNCDPPTDLSDWSHR